MSNVAAQRIVVLRPGALGDAVLTLPVLESLADAQTGADVVVIGSPVFRLAAACGLAAEWLAFDDVRLLGLFAPGGSSPVVAGADVCIVYGRDDPFLKANLERSGVGRVVVWPAAPAEGTHIVDHLLGGLEAAGWCATTHTPRLAPLCAWLDAADAFLDERGLAPGFVAMHAGSGGRAKRWPAEQFAQVAERLGEQVLWLAGPAEDEDKAIRKAGKAVGTIAHNVPLPTLAGLLARSGLYVGNDSGVSHLAAAVGAPTIAVFGATDPAVWAPRGSRVAVVGSPEHGGLGAVTVDDVLDATGRLMGRHLR